MTSPAAAAPSRIKVLELTGAVAGPFASRILADLGAEVIKVERPPLGDMIRYISPLGFTSQGQFTYGSAGKKSLCIELAEPEGREIVRELVRHVDVFLENFTPGAIDRLGFDYETLCTLNPNIIMCSLSGFGQTGPLRDVRAVDATIQGWSGNASMIGEPDETPYIYRSAPNDSGTGSQAALAIYVALYNRELTGRGQHVEVAMLDSAIALDCFTTPAILASGGTYHPRRAGRLHPTGCAGVGRAAGRDIVIDLDGSGPNSAWQRLVLAMGKTELVEDLRFVDQAARIANQKALFVMIDDWLASMGDPEAALQILKAAGVAAAPVLTTWEALTQPLIQNRSMVRDVRRSDGTTVPSIATPYRFSDLPVTVGPTSFIGEHNEEVLQSYLGYDNKRIEDLKAKGILYKESTASGPVIDD